MHRPFYSLMAALSLTAALAACADEPTPPAAAANNSRPAGPSLTAWLYDVSADPAPLSFGQTVYRTSKTDILTLTNTGSNTAAIGAIDITGTNALEFNTFSVNGATPDCGSCSRQARNASSACSSIPRRLGRATARSTSW